MNLLEKILAAHSGKASVSPGEIIDIGIDIRAARDFGGANVIKNLSDAGLDIADPQKTIFTFDCNPTGSDQKYAVNQHICRLFAREQGIKVYDIDAGIGTHILIDKGLVVPGSTAVSTDSHANILGAIGAFGQGMGDMDIASAWHSGTAWFRVPDSVKISLDGALKPGITSKDIVLNLLRIFGPDSLLNHFVEMGGSVTEKLSLDDRITISSMATEMGAIAILFPPGEEVISYCSARSGSKVQPVYADENATYSKTVNIDVSDFLRLVALPGAPHDTTDVLEAEGTKIDSVFIGSCTNGRISDMRLTADVLKGRRIAPGVTLKIVPATDEVWKQCLDEGIIGIFKNAGALVSNAGCAGCAAGQVGQNGKGEITVSTGNRNFPGKQGNGSVYLASPAVAAASAIAGFITIPEKVPSEPMLFMAPGKKTNAIRKEKMTSHANPEMIEGKAWLIPADNIDTDMIFHNSHLSVTNRNDMGKYTFGNMKGYEDFASKAGKGDIVIAGRNFGCGSSRQQAVDCFSSLGISAIIASSFGAIYERNAINAAFPVITFRPDAEGEIKNGDIIKIDLKTGMIWNITTGKELEAEPFSDVQLEIYRKGGLLA